MCIRDRLSRLLDRPILYALAEEGKDLSFHAAPQDLSLIHI